MKLEKCIINFNSEESVEFLLDTMVSSFDDVQQSLDKFKETEEYKKDEYDDDFVLDWLTEDGIVLIPLNIDTVYGFELPSPEID